MVCMCDETAWSCCRTAGSIPGVGFSSLFFSRSMMTRLSSDRRSEISQETVLGCVTTFSTLGGGLMLAMIKISDSVEDPGGGGVGSSGKTESRKENSRLMMCSHIWPIRGQPK